jgi:hypothetical protein
LLRPPFSQTPSDEDLTLRTGFAYLNIGEPLVAWLTYRAEMVSAGAGAWPGMSSWLAARFFAVEIGAAGAGTRLARELELERVRALKVPGGVSRLRGFFLFPDEPTAERARVAWPIPDSHRLVEVGLLPDAQVNRYDSEWITTRLPAPGDFSWGEDYFLGRPQGGQPLWELVVDGRALIYGTEVREAAYEVVKRTWPESLALLEIARLGVELGSDIGLISAHPTTTEEGRTRVDYHMDMRDAENPELLERLEAFRGPKNGADLLGVSQEVWFRTPNLMDSCFFIP